MNTLTLDHVINEHKLQLGSAAKKFAAPNNVDLIRHINKALGAFSRRRRLTLVGEIDLVANQSDYLAPADMIAAKVSHWGRGMMQPWQKGYSRLPALTSFSSAAGEMLHLRPAPTAAQIQCFGAKYKFFYLALHKLERDASNTTIKDADGDLFLLMCSIEAMKELVTSGATEPVSLHKGMGSVNSNLTPVAALEALTKQLELRR